MTRLLDLTDDELETVQLMVDAALSGTAAAPSPKRRLVVETLARKLDALEPRSLEQLLGALEFYADHDQYGRLTAIDAIPSELRVGDARVMVDRGSRARLALRRDPVTS